MSVFAVILVILGHCVVAPELSYPTTLLTHSQSATAFHSHLQFTSFSVGHSFVLVVVSLSDFWVMVRCWPTFLTWMVDGCFTRC